MKKLGVSQLLVITFSMLFLSGTDSLAQAQVNTQYFPETNHTIEGRFLVYWESHGGLAQQGYPLSDELLEKSDLDGKTYTVQYFERAVFEYHPENQPPYDVLLTQLGRLRYEQKYADGAPQPQIMSGETRLFHQTGESLSGRFLAYWQQHGGLEQQGYPISTPLIETSELDGKSYLVQYFERAVFEYHPENQPPHDVLLSQLGRMLYEQKYASIATSIPRLITHMAALNVVAIGHYLFWVDGRSNGTTVYGYDLTKQEQFLVTHNLAGPLTKDGTLLAWAEPPDSNRKIRIEDYDPDTRSETTIYEFDFSGDTKNFEGPPVIAVDNGMLYYMAPNTDPTLGFGLYARNLATGQERLISASGENPVAADGTLLWSEVTYPRRVAHIILHFLKVDGSKADTTIVSADGCSTGYGISGDNVVWSLGCGAEDSRVYLYNISSASSKPISPVPANPFDPNPLISGSNTVWTNPPSGEPNQPTLWSIGAYDTDTEAVWMPVRESRVSVQAAALIGQDALAYTTSDGLYLISLR